ncbi:MAG: VWA domain-containing protein, partial [Spirochaeta sp.]|nr:VWA domain-containing protein [Spirochaeta sp.]
PRVWSVAFLYRLSILAFWLGVVVCIVALSSPARVYRERINLTRGMDIVFVLDESPTMAATDFEPYNRFEAAQRIIRRFVQGRENDGIGLVSFSRDAALRVPPTVDHQHLLDELDSLSIMELGDGTAIGLGIALGALHLQSSTAEQRVLILLTDGKNNVSEILPDVAAGVARDLGVRIHTVGIGSPGEIPIEFTDPHTNRTYRGIVSDAYEAETLRELANITGGNFFEAASLGSLEAVFQTLDTVETVERRARVEVRTESLYRHFIILGLLLIMFDFVARRVLLGERL